MGRLINNYRQLLVWQRSMGLVEVVFQMCKKLPDEQRYGLISQMQRAAVSIPSNIAEGNAKRLGKDYQRHLKMAAGSLAELETPNRIMRPSWISYARRRSRNLGKLTRCRTTAQSIDFKPFLIP